MMGLIWLKLLIMSNLTELCPIRNMGMLSRGLYRGAQPLYGYEYEWLKKHLRTRHLINLRKEAHIDDKHTALFASVTNIDVPDHGIPTDEQVKKFVHIIKNKNDVFFHCEHGRGRTSLFSVIARLAMGWTLHKAMTEEKERFGYEFQHPAQEEYLKNFNHELLKS